MVIAPAHRFFLRVSTNFNLLRDHNFFKSSVRFLAMESGRKKNVVLPTLPQAKYFPAVTAQMLPDGCLKDRVALVTGGGTGIGQSIAHRLSSLGAKVIIASRKFDVLEATASKITEKTGNQVVPIAMNVRDVDDIHKALDECEAKVGLPTIVISNAAANFISPTEKLSPNAWKAIVDTVFFGAAMLIVDVGKRLIAAQKPGTFLAISTTYARESGSAFVVPSASSKAAVEIMHKSLAVEWARYGLRFNIIEPGPFYTEGAFSRLDPTGQWTENMIKDVPAGRLGELGELSNIVSYMVSDYASFMTGSVIRFDGGNEPCMAGMFNQLRAVNDEQWQQLEKLIRPKM